MLEALLPRSLISMPRRKQPSNADRDGSSLSDSNGTQIKNAVVATLGDRRGPGRQHEWVKGDAIGRLFQRSRCACIPPTPVAAVWHHPSDTIRSQAALRPRRLQTIYFLRSMVLSTRRFIALFNTESNSPSILYISKAFFSYLKVIPTSGVINVYPALSTTCKYKQRVEN